MRLCVCIAQPARSMLRHASSQVQRTITAVTRAFVNRHETFSTFLSMPLDGLQRWQSTLRLSAAEICKFERAFTFTCVFSRSLSSPEFVIIVTLVIEQLLVNIWMYYSKVRSLRAYSLCTPHFTIC